MQGLLNTYVNKWGGFATTLSPNLIFSQTYVLHSKQTVEFAFSQSISLSIGKISALNPTFQS